MGHPVCLKSTLKRNLTLHFGFIVDVIVSTTRRRRDIKILLCLSACHSEKFNMVSNDHGRKQKCDFCVSLFKTNFTDHHTPDTIHMVLETWFWSVKCTTVTLRCAKILSISIPSHNVSQCKRLQWLDYMKTNHFKMLLNAFSTTYAYSNCMVYRLFYCWKIS